MGVAGVETADVGPAGEEMSARSVLSHPLRWPRRGGRHTSTPRAAGQLCGGGQDQADGLGQLGSDESGTVAQLGPGASVVQPDAAQASHLGAGDVGRTVVTDHPGTGGPVADQWEAAPPSCDVEDQRIGLGAPASSETTQASTRESSPVRRIFSTWGRSRRCSRWPASTRPTGPRAGPRHGC